MRLDSAYFLVEGRSPNDAFLLGYVLRSRLNFGNEPPLVADRRRRPDRRQVSARWLAGTLLTGLTSSALMGIALAAALDGHQDLSTPRRVPIVAGVADLAIDKGGRLVDPTLPSARNRETLELSTMTKEGDREVIRTLPFGYVNMTLAERSSATTSYPPFDAFKLLGSGDDGKDGAVSNDEAQLYGAKVESEMSFKIEPFSFSDHQFAGRTSTEEAEALVRSVSSNLSDIPVQVASIEPFDSSRFSPDTDVAVYEPGSAFRVVAENVSIAPRDVAPALPRYVEEIIPFRETSGIAKVLGDSAYPSADIKAAVAALRDALGADQLDSGSVLRVGAEMARETKRIVRLSAYRESAHVATVAKSDGGGFAMAAEPDESEAVAEAFDEGATEAPLRSEMPTVYDGIYQAALGYGLNERMCQQVLKMLATDVDFQAHVSPEDRLVVFFSMDEGQDKATENSQVLYVEASLGGKTKRYYRFRSAGDDHYDYYDQDGRSAKQFLLRTPVPNGRFTSPFGARVHPILGYARPHWGVDWAAPTGTPILASGDGVVESAGQTSGYGRQTIIRHANGYETSYSHQSAIARGVKPGATVRQGQVIGAVGSTGLSTGSHLHYEVIVNGQKVDPMRIKFPSGRILQGEELEVFRKERDRIDDLLKDRAEAQRVAAR